MSIRPPQPIEASPTVAETSLFVRMARLMHKGQWHQALDLLDLESEEVQSQAPLLCLAARCCQHLGQQVQAQHLATQALHLDPDHTYATLLNVRLHQSAGDLPGALKLAAWGFKQAPHNGLIRRALADLLVPMHGDWHGAQQLMRPLAGNVCHAAAVSAFWVKHRQYNDAQSGLQLSQQIVRFARQNLQLPAQPPATPQAAKPHAAVRISGASTGRKRVGLVSPLFRAGPVYYLCFGALREWAQDVDLVFFSRSGLNDWATQELRTIAYEWHDLTGATAHTMHAQLKNAQLDALFDLSGWLDIEVLKALSSKPAPKLFKWVGGQVCTTGLNSFDGFITDKFQTHQQYTALHTEPLLALRAGYVTYTPPPYMPQARRPDPAGPPVAGVISHPMKLSEAFLAYLRDQIQTYAQQGGRPVVLRFVGKRYGLQPVQQRLRAALFGTEEQMLHTNAHVELQFVSTQGHAGFLEAVAALDWVVDTFPYSCGLTALEALHLGVPVRTRPGAHTHERHAYSHCRYAGLGDDDILLSKLGAFGPPTLQKSGHSLLQPGSARLAHRALADSLNQLLAEAPLLARPTTAHLQAA